MKDIKAIDFYRRMIKVSGNIVSFYLVNPTECRYERCKKILDRLMEFNDNTHDNEYRHDIWNMLFTTKTILTNIGTVIFDAKSKKQIAPQYRNRKVTLELSNIWCHLNSDKP